MALYNSEDEACLPSVELGVGDTSCEGATRFEWSQLAGPAASQTVFDTPTQETTNAIGVNPGLYTYERCCFFEVDGPDQPSQPLPDGIQCPLSVVSGETHVLGLIGCDGIATWASSDGSIVPVDNASAIWVASNPTMAPIVDFITVSCENTDGTIQNFSCPVNVYPADQLFNCVASEPFTIEVKECGERCTCEQVDVLFVDCDATNEPEKEPIDFGEKEQFPTLPKTSIPELVRARMTGSPLPAYVCANTEYCCGQEICCCDEHRSVILWNDVFNCGWEYQADAVNGTNIYNGMGYNVGGKWCFKGTTTITMSGPPAFIDTIVLWGHNLTDATITTAPYFQGNGPNGDDPVQVGLISDKSCLEGYSAPVILYLSNVDDSVENFTITITPADPTKTICINHVFAGQKFFFNDDWALPDDWVNPFFGSDREVTVREGSCGPVSVSSKRRRRSLSIPIDCYGDAEYKECILPILRYAHCGNPIMFAWSINRCPQDLFYGWVDGTNDGTTFEGCFNKGSIDVSGFTSQPQPKDFV